MENTEEQFGSFGEQFFSKIIFRRFIHEKIGFKNQAPEMRFVFLQKCAEIFLPRKTRQKNGST